MTNANTCWISHEHTVVMIVEPFVTVIWATWNFVQILKAQMWDSVVPLHSQKGYKEEKDRTKLQFGIILWLFLGTSLSMHKHML